MFTDSTISVKQSGNNNKCSKPMDVSLLFVICLQFSPRIIFFTVGRTYCRPPTLRNKSMHKNITNNPNPSIDKRDTEGMPLSIGNRNGTGVLLSVLICPGDSDQPFAVYLCHRRKLELQTKKDEEETRAKDRARFIAAVNGGKEFSGVIARSHDMMRRRRQRMVSETCEICNISAKLNS